VIQVKIVCLPAGPLGDFRTLDEFKHRRVDRQDEHVNGLRTSNSILLIFSPSIHRIPSKAR